MKVYTRIMEVFWLAASIFTAGLCIYVGYQKGWAEPGFLYAMPGVSLGLWYMRRRYRIKIQEYEKQQRNQ